MVRTVLKHIYRPAVGRLSVECHVYVSRLAFYLIADPAVKAVMDAVHSQPFCVTRTLPLPGTHARRQFRSSGKEMLVSSSSRVKNAVTAQHLAGTGAGLGSGSAQALDVDDSGLPRADHPSSFAFSLAGLLKWCESEGYPCARAQPPALAVPLFDYQRSTYQWMLDQERLPSPLGLNAYFWEVMRPYILYVYHCASCFLSLFPS